jgi:hypothetical protein
LLKFPVRLPRIMCGNDSQESKVESELAYCM